MAEGEPDSEYPADTSTIPQHRATQQQRKMEGKIRKKQRIVESGGVRPRTHLLSDGGNTTTDNDHPQQQPQQRQQQQQQEQHTKGRGLPSAKTTTATKVNNYQKPQQHRFGRVMEQVPCRNVPRLSTLSIAIPGSIVSNCQTKELKTILCGQIARMATIYHVDEIIVYDDKLSKVSMSTTTPQQQRMHGLGGNSSDRKRPASFSRQQQDSKDTELTDNNNNNNNSDNRHGDNPPSSSSSYWTTTDPHIFMGRILQYCECPQYLRKHFFPLHSDLQYTGLLPPMDAPHHVRATDRCVYREGVVLRHAKDGGTTQPGSLVNCGIRNRPVQYVKTLMVGGCPVLSPNAMFFSYSHWIQTFVSHHMTHFSSRFTFYSFFS
jgi:predicted SPOUT superfamily RNA methylase MTH1